MFIFLWILFATLFVSLISLVGIFTFYLKPKTLKTLLFILVGFATGGLMGGAFFHLLPESLAELNPINVFLFVLFGFVLFFLIERVLHWRHCHKGHCNAHLFTYMSLIGDGVHNFIDGAIISISFFVSIPFGIITTLAIIFHEIPQEIGDFGILVYGGFSKFKALMFNLLSALTAILGALLTYFASDSFMFIRPFLLAFAAGGFIYVAASDLIPELHKETDFKKSISSFIFFIVGLLFMFLITFLFKG